MTLLSSASKRTVTFLEERFSISFVLRALVAGHLVDIQILWLILSESHGNADFSALWSSDQ